MKKVLTLLVLSLFMAGVTATPMYAASASKDKAPSKEKIQKQDKKELKNNPPEGIKDAKDGVKDGAKDLKKDAKDIKDDAKKAPKDAKEGFKEGDKFAPPEK